MRVIGVRHRIKQSAHGEARPTQIAIYVNKEFKVLDLETEQDELDFLLNRFPIAWKKVEKEDIPEGIPAHHIVETKTGIKIPSKYEGYVSGDKVVSILGGSGDRFMAALSRRGEEIGSEVFRIPAHDLKNLRVGEETKEDDSKILVDVFFRFPDSFAKMSLPDRELIEVKEALAARKDTQKSRIACSQRIRQRFVGKIFLSEDGRYPEGSIEERYEAEAANDVILNALKKEEAKADLRLKKAIERIPVYQLVLSDVVGIGPALAAGIIAPIGDVRRFPTVWKFSKFCGTHVQPDGRFPRRRAGEYSGYNPSIRQAIYLFTDQANRRKDSFWGARLLEIKAEYRKKHPLPERTDKGTMRYTDGHILKMAKWRLATEFTHWLYKEWMNLAQRQAKSAA